MKLILFWLGLARFFKIDNPIANQEPTFAITDTKLYVPTVTLSTQNNAERLKQLKLGFKRTTNWNKYEPKLTVKEQNRYLDLLINPGFQGEIGLLFYQLKILVVEQITRDIIFR